MSRLSDFFAGVVSGVEHTGGGGVDVNALQAAVAVPQEKVQACSNTNGGAMTTVIKM